MQKTITVAAKALTITANNASRAYGAANPASPGVMAPGLVGGDTVVVTYSYAATASATAAVGSSHAITPSAAQFTSGSAANYTITYAPGTLTIAGTASQSITFAPPATATYGDGALTLSASSTSALPVSLTLVNGPGSLVNNVLTITGAGTITVKASQAGNSSFAAASDVQQTIVVNKGSATINLDSSSLNQTFDDSRKSVTATTTPTGLTTTITYNGNTIPPSAVGSYAVVVTITDGNFQGSVTGTLVIASQTSSCGAHHWTQLPGGTSPSIMHLAGNLTINGRAANSCDEIAVYDSTGTVVGYYHVQNNGQYGDMAVNGDVAATSTVDEGAVGGEKLTLRVWDGTLQQEYAMPSVLQLTPQQNLSSYTNYQGPLTFIASGMVLMDVAVETGIPMALKAGWNMFGWATKQGSYEGSTVPQASDLIGGGIMSSVSSKQISDVFGTMGFTTAETIVAVGPDGVVYTPGSPFNTLKKLLPGKGYWLYVPVAKTITIPGSPLAATDQLSMNLGWTQIGYWGTDGATPATGFGCISGQYDVVVDEAGKVYVTGSPFNTLKSMQKNKGYFIHTTTPTTLRYQCQ